MDKPDEFPFVGKMPDARGELFWLQFTDLSLQSVTSSGAPLRDDNPAAQLHIGLRSQIPSFNLTVKISDSVVHQAIAIHIPVCMQQLQAHELVFGRSQASNIPPQLNPDL